MLSLLAEAQQDFPWGIVVLVVNAVVALWLFRSPKITVVKVVQKEDDEAE